MKSNPLEIVRTVLNREAVQHHRSSLARGREDATPATERVIAGYDGPAGLASVAIPGIAAIVLAGVVSQTFAPDNCRTTPPLAEFLPEIRIAMSVRAGAACQVWARSTNDQIDMMTITLSPQHGTAKPRGRTGVIYRPAPGFRGEDAFEYVRQGVSSRYRGSSLVRVNVRVD